MKFLKNRQRKKIKANNDPNVDKILIIKDNRIVLDREINR